MLFGIDLGTTYSSVARIDETGQPAIVRSAMGEEATPSVVYFESRGSVRVGQQAKNESLIAPELSADLVKREIGEETEYVFHGERHTPETVTALILRELSRAAKEQVGEEITEAVITVPASFGIAQRAATQRAAEFAGMRVLDVRDEPVAAAMHYRALARAADDGEGARPRHLLVYDLGGGTFDTSVIRLEGDAIDVVCTDGDGHLGGADWDQAIVEYLLAQIAREHPGLRPEEDPQFMRDVRLSAEELKIALSSVRSRPYSMRFKGTVTSVELTRDLVEELTADLLERTVTVTERIVETARPKSGADIDELLLVGGMSRFPAVARVLKERLGLEPRQREPEFAVAKGAALFALAANVKSGGSAVEDVEKQTGLSAAQVRGLAATKVAPVISRSFGVKSLDPQDPRSKTDPAHAREIVAHLLRKGTALPNDTGSYPFQTVEHNTRMLPIEVWEQSGPEESDDPALNRKIGEGILRNLPPRLPAGTRIEVTFVMSETGTLSVHAIEPLSRTELRFDLQIGDYDQAGRDKARHAVAKYKVSG